MTNSGMLKKLEEVEIKYIEIEQNLNAEGLDPEKIRKLSMERAELEEIINTFREYKEVVKNIENNKLLLADKELSELAKEENVGLEEEKSRLENSTLEKSVFEKTLIFGLDSLVITQ